MLAAHQYLGDTVCDSRAITTQLNSAITG